MEKRHYLRPLSGRTTTGRHLLLWVDADEKQTVLKAAGTQAIDMVLSGRAVKAWTLGPWQGVDGLETMLDACTKGKGTLTIWLCRGWEDLILTGLAELIDKNICTWRYAMLDGQRLLIRGTWRGKSVVISSIANWTGGRWNAWPHALEDEQSLPLLTGIAAEARDRGHAITGGCRLALATLAAVYCTSMSLGCNRLTPSSAGAAMQVWRRWLGPRLLVERAVKGKGKGRQRAKTVEIVAPSPFRPARCVEAERHCCYGHIARQLRRGLVDEKLYVMDIKSAYLLCLATMPVPTHYRRTLHRPTVDEACQRMGGGTGAGLVRIDTTDYCYPVRRGRRVYQASGNYWTWLAGHELALALCEGHAKEIQTLYVWNSRRMEGETASQVITLSELLKRRGSPAGASAWRAIYSSLIGQFACRRKVWVDVPPRPGFERWSEWQRADCSSGQVVNCRSIAGKHQELRQRSETSTSVPLMFACVSSYVHWLVQSLAQTAGLENVVQVVADSLWTTRAGWERLQSAAELEGFGERAIATKAVYDRGWFSGRHVCVVEKNGRRYLRAPGVGDGAALDEAGKVCRQAALPWSQCETVTAAEGCRRRKVSFPGQCVIDRYGRPAEVLPLGEPLNDGMLAAELLEPVRTGRTVADG